MTDLVGRRIAVGGFMHETNTFQREPTTYADFAGAGDRPPLTRGESVFTRFEGMNTSIAGAMSVLRAAGAMLVPLPWASTTPAGYVTRDAYERIAAMIVDDLRAALPVDAVYLSLHGAMVAEHVEDAEGELLARIRSHLGNATPVVASLDFHSNTTRRMFELSDAMVAYCTYPHVDMADAGAKAARILREILVRDRRPEKAYRQLDYLIPLTWQCTSIEPAKSIFAHAARMIDDRVCSTSFTPGFPAADIRDCGASVFAYGWDRDAVERAVDTLHRLVVEAEARFDGKLWTPTQAVREAMRRTAADSRTVILADTQDNPGVGGRSDTIGLLEALLAERATDAVLGVLWDPDAAAAAHAAGTGATINVGVGAKTGEWGEHPLLREWIVERLGDGQMTCRGPMLDGWKLALGPVALLRSGGVSVVVSSRKVQPMDPAPFHHVGIEPAAQRILALKSSVHFRAAFESIAQAILIVESPGAMIVDPGKLPFTRLRPGVRLSPLGRPFPGPAG